MYPIIENPTTGTATNPTTAGGCTGVGGNPEWIGDAYCDDENNNMDCSYDGGDCCGCNVNIEVCNVCVCLDPNASGGSTTCPPTTTTAGGCTGIGGDPSWIGDAYCDDINNNMDCSYDGGDCCGCNVNTQYCSVCACLDPNGNGGGTTCPPITTTTHNPGNYAPVLNYSIQTGKTCC